MIAAPLVRGFRPLDELEWSLIESCRDAARAEHRFLKLLREFDLRRGWEAYGNNDCAEWLDWRCGISRTTAQEKVRVARALWVLPKIDASFAGGLSYSKVRALTRVASDVTEAELPRESLEVVLAALERVGSRLPEDPTRSLVAKAADALVQMAKEVLADDNAPASAGVTSSSAEGHQVVVHVDASALSSQGGESDLPLPTVRRLCCDGAVVPVLEKHGAARRG
jgi:hypothetical protein